MEPEWSAQFFASLSEVRLYLLRMNLFGIRWRMLEIVFSPDLKTPCCRRSLPRPCVLLVKPLHLLRLFYGVPEVAEKAYWQKGLLSGAGVMAKRWFLLMEEVSVTTR
jgi:hypothetical protein